MMSREIIGDIDGVLPSPRTADLLHPDNTLLEEIDTLLETDIRILSTKLDERDVALDALTLQALPWAVVFSSAAMPRSALQARGVIV